MRYAPLLLPALLLIALLLAAGCQDVSFGSTKMGDFGNSPEEKAVVNDLIQKYGNPATNSGPPRFLEPLVTTKLSEKLVPVDKVTVFSKDVPSVWFWAVYDNFAAGDPLTLTWTYLDQEKDLLSVNRQCTGEFGRAYGEFVRPDKGWPLGNHRITISGRGITASADFRIQEGATQTVPLPWPAGIEVNVTTLPAVQPTGGVVSCFEVRMNRTSAPVLATMNAGCSKGDMGYYAWDFGDGTPPQVLFGEAGRSTQHTYFTEGGYRITLDVATFRRIPRLDSKNIRDGDTILTDEKGLNLIGLQTSRGTMQNGDFLVKFVDDDTTKAMIREIPVNPVTAFDVPSSLIGGYYGVYYACHPVYLDSGCRDDIRIRPASSTDSSFMKMYVSGPLSLAGECSGPGPGYTVCMGKCANLETDRNNCGWCNNRCPGTPCVKGECEKLPHPSTEMLPVQNLPGL